MLRPSCHREVFGHLIQAKSTVDGGEFVVDFAVGVSMAWKLAMHLCVVWDPVSRLHAHGQRHNRHSGGARHPGIVAFRRQTTYKPAAHIWSQKANAARSLGEIQC